MSFLRNTLPALVLTTISLGSCKKDSGITPRPTTITATQLLTTGSWRLDQVKVGGQVTGTGAGIKDQFSLSFSIDESYTQKTLASNTFYRGTWLLSADKTMLELTDNKGTRTEYLVTNLSASELRYTYTNKTNQLEERTFSAQP